MVQIHSPRPFTEYRFQTLLRPAAWLAEPFPIGRRCVTIKPAIEAAVRLLPDSRIRWSVAALGKSPVHSRSRDGIGGNIADLYRKSFLLM